MAEMTKVGAIVGVKKAQVEAKVEDKVEAKVEAKLSKAPNPAFQPQISFMAAFPFSPFMSMSNQSFLLHRHHQHRGTRGQLHRDVAGHVWCHDRQEVKLLAVLARFIRAFEKISPRVGIQ